MFRDVLRNKQQLSEQECIDILKNEPRGVLSVLGDNDYTYGVPMNFWYCDEDGKLYFHSAKSGHKLDALKKHDKVSFCVYDQGFRKEGDWALYIKSVIVFGKVAIVQESERAIDICRKLSFKYTSDADYIEHEIETSGDGVLCFELIPEHITGKLVHEA